MNVSIRRLELLTAVTIVLAVVDLPTLVIDVFGIPLPRLAFGMSWFTAAALVVVLICLPIHRSSGARVLGLWDGAYAISLIVWALVEYLRGGFGTFTHASIILAWVPPWIVSVAVRMHVSVFGRVTPVVRFFVWAVTILCTAHLAMVAFATAGVRPPFVRIEELIDRNSLSLVLTAAVFVLAVWERQDTPTRAWWLIAIIVLGFAHAELNHARAAKLILVLVVGMQLARMAVFSDRAMVRVCVLLSSVTIATVASIGIVLEWLSRPDVFGAGDAAASTTFRGQTNSALLQLFIAHPWIGAGLEQLTYVRRGGYIGHTLYLNIAAAFGIVGLFPAVGLMVWRWLGRRGTVAVELSMTLVVVIAVASFMNDPQMWYGLVLALPSARDTRTNAAPRAVRTMTWAHLRPYTAAAAGVALVTFSFLAWWMLQREPFVATGELEFAETASNSRLTAVEASGDAEEFVQIAVLRHSPALRDQCSVSGRLERQALTVICKGHTETEAMQAVDRILQPVLNRHKSMFEEQRRAAALVSDLDRDALHHLHQRVKSLEEQDPVRSADHLLRSLVGLQRARLSRNLMRYEATAKREHPSRVVGGIRVSVRPSRMMLCGMVSVAAALIVLLSLAIGTAARDALRDTGVSSS